MSTSAYEDHRSAWVSREELAERLIPLIGRLYRDFGVVTSVHGHRIINLSAMGVIEAHERARQLGHQELTLEQTEAVLEAANAMPSHASDFDRGLAAGITLVSYRDRAQKLEAVYRKKIADLEELKKSLLQKAFSGEL